jgi:hypothetical protein
MASGSEMGPVKNQGTTLCSPFTPNNNLIHKKYCNSNAYKSKLIF